MNSLLASKLRGNRKGDIAIDEAIPAIVFILIGVFVLFIFFILTPPSDEQKKLLSSAELASNDAERTLVRALTLPVDGVPVGRLIVEFYYERGDLSQVASTLTESFSKWSPGGWVVVVKDPSNEVSFSHRSQLSDADIAAMRPINPDSLAQENWKEAANAQLPLLGWDGALTVKLYSPDTGSEVKP